MKQLQHLCNLEALNVEVIKDWSFTRISRMFHWIRRFASHEVKENNKMQAIIVALNEALKIKRERKKNRVVDCHPWKNSK